MTTKGITGSCSRAGSKDTYWGSSSESGGNSASSGHWAAKLGSGFRPYIWKPFLAWAYSPRAAPASSGEWSGTQGLPAPTEGLAPGGPWSLGHGLGTVPTEQPPPNSAGPPVFLERGLPLWGCSRTLFSTGNYLRLPASLSSGFWLQSEVWS